MKIYNVYSIILYNKILTSNLLHIYKRYIDNLTLKIKKKLQL